MTQDFLLLYIYCFRTFFIGATMSTRLEIQCPFSAFFLKLRNLIPFICKLIFSSPWRRLKGLKVPIIRQDKKFTYLAPKGNSAKWWKINFRISWLINMRLLSGPVFHIPRQGPNACSQCSSHILIQGIEDDPLVPTSGHLPLLPLYRRGVWKTLFYFQWSILRNKNTIFLVHTIFF